MLRPTLPGLATHQDLQLPVLTRVRGVLALIGPAHAHLALHHVLDLGAVGACWPAAATGPLATAGCASHPATQPPSHAGVWKDRCTSSLGKAEGSRRPGGQEARDKAAPGSQLPHPGLPGWGLHPVCVHVGRSERAGLAKRVRKGRGAQPTSRRRKQCTAVMTKPCAELKTAKRAWKSTERRSVMARTADIQVSASRGSTTQELQSEALRTQRRVREGDTRKR